MHGVSDTKSVCVQPGGHKKYRTLAATHPVAFLFILTLNGAKVLLFFDMSKFFGKKMQEMVVFWKISAKIGKFRSKNPVFRVHSGQNVYPKSRFWVHKKAPIFGVLSSRISLVCGSYVSRWLLDRAIHSDCISVRRKDALEVKYLIELDGRM